MELAASPLLEKTGSDMGGQAPAKSNLRGLHGGKSKTAQHWHVAREEITPELAIEWDSLSNEGVASPYQSRAWVTAFLETAARAAGQSPAILTVRGEDGKLLGLFPMAVKTGRKIKTAFFVGDKHANHHMPLLEADFAATLSPRRCRDLMLDMARALPGLDAFVFINQPRLWNGLVPPLVPLAAWPSVQPAYALSLLPDGISAMERAMSSHARKSLRNKRRRLEEMGKVAMLAATTPDEIDEVKQAFMAQKAARFAGLGIADPFAEPGVMEMLGCAALPADGCPPAILWHALTLDGRIIATFIGVADKLRYSGMATSFIAEDAIARFSPGEALLHDLIKDQADAGRVMFDLGVGEARYKLTFCDTVEHMCESVLPFTAKGYVLLAGLQLKRMAKQCGLAMQKRFPMAARLLRKAMRRG